MCGLLVTTDADVVGSHRWRRALHVIGTRGPDATGEWRADGIAFGHKRLSIIGLGPQGAQPMATDSDHVLVFNGEIYNFRELAKELGINASSDTQVLYEIGRRDEWSRWIRRLRGMFAFVHYNGTDKTITVARDPFGIKPLFARRDPGGGLSFASTVAALIELSPRTLEPSAVALAGFLANGVFSHGTSAFSEISKIEPGAVQAWRRTSQGWLAEREHIADYSWPTQTIREALHDSVAAHLVADVEVGVLLSGGVDSTLIAALAAEMSPGVRTFCLTNPDNPSIDEAALARHNASLLGTAHVEVPVTPATLANRADALIRSTGEPFSDAAYLPLSALSEVVAEHVKVALAGEGADELFCGYRRYDVERLIDSRGLGSALRVAGRAAAFDARWPHPLSQRDRSLHASALKDPLDRHAVLMFAEWATIRRHFPGGDDAYAAFSSRWDACVADPWALGQPPNRAYDTREWLPNVFLEKSDRASMLYSLELRTPYLDPVVARAATGYRPRNSRKQVLRDELHRLLPDVALPTQKKGLSVDIPALVARHYSDLVRGTVLDPQSVLASIGLRDPEGFMRAVSASPSLAFRVGMVGLWQEIWL